MMHQCIALTAADGHPVNGHWPIGEKKVTCASDNSSCVLNMENGQVHAVVKGKSEK